jgi:hypothetical protein
MTLSDHGRNTDRRVSERILGVVPKRHLLTALAVLVAVAVPALLLLSPVIATAVVIGTLTLLGVAAMAADWEEHPDFEAREMARARRRKEKWERTADARAKDRARWEAYQAKKAAKDGPSTS